MSDCDPSALDPYYIEAKEFARELVTLIKTAEQYNADHDGHEIRGQIRQQVKEWGALRTWLLIEVLARSVAATYDDLDDWSAAVIQVVADEGEATP